MRRLLLAAVITALVVGIFAGVASARLAEPAEPRKRAAPLVVPAVPPEADRALANAYGYRSGDAIGAAMAATSHPASAAAAGAGAAVTVTAIVLPVVILVVDDDRHVRSIFTNTTDRAARSVIFLVKRGSVAGAPEPLDATLWGHARSALARAHEGTGIIWKR